MSQDTVSMSPDTVSISLVPRPHGRREKRPGIHYLPCENDSRNFSRTSPIMDKLHVVVMRRNNQTRYTAYSVAAVFTRRRLPLSETQAVHDKNYATTTASSTVTVLVLVVETNGSLVADGHPKSRG